LKVFPSRLLRSELIRSASVLISGTVIAQLISILLQPFLRRFFPVEAFGTYSVYMSIVGIVAVITTLRYDDAIVLPRNDKESANVIALSLSFNLAFNLILFLIIAFRSRQILNFLNLPSGFPSSVLYLIPLSVLLLNSYQGFNFWLIRKKRYIAVSANKMGRRGSEGLAQVLFALSGNPKGLIFSDIIGQSANVATAAVQGFRKGLNFKLVGVTKLKYVFKKYSDFPKYNLIPALMNTCSYFLPPVFINKFFSATYTGYFDLTKLVLTIPIAFVASSFSNVLLQKISEKYNSGGSIAADLKPVFAIVMVICIMEIAAIYLFGEWLFRVIFGEDWIISGKISGILVWSFAFSFIVSSFSSLFVAMRRIKTYSIWQLLYFLAIISLVFFKDLEFVQFLKTYVLIEVICYTLVSVLLAYIVISYEKSVNRQAA
jgi:O-antigen/teichoic acid export membrane protein